MLTIQEIMTDVETYYKLDHGAMLEQDRHKTVAKARKMAMYLSRKYTSHSWAELADTFHRDHSTIIKQLRYTEDLYPDACYFESKYDDGLLKRIWGKICGK